MTSFSHFRFTLLALGTAIVLSGPTMAQDSGGADIWSVPDQTGAPQTSAGTPQLEMTPIQKARAMSEGKLGYLAQQGHMSPLVKDVSKYSDETVSGLNSILNTGDDPCIQAVRAALYLDAHLEEADWTQRALGYKEGAGKIAENTIALLLIPGANDVLASMSQTLGRLDLIIKGYKIYQITEKYYAKSPDVRNGVWTNEIVTQAANSSWSSSDIEQKRDALEIEAKAAAENLAVVQQDFIDALRYVDMRYESAVQTAMYTLRRDTRAFQAKVMGVKPEEVSDKQLNLSLDLNTYPKFRHIYDKQIQAAKDLKNEEQKVVAEESYVVEQKARFAVERALIQRDALARYAAPLVRGDCAEIRRTGPVAKPKPDAVDEVLKLPHDKLLIFLDSIGQKPTLDMMNCICRRAGYGTSSTSQFYHPETIEPYDKRYSCQHPGPPCIVSGYGCSRHPLPSDKQIWIDCGEVSGEDVNGAIVTAVTARQSKQ